MTRFTCAAGALFITLIASATQGLFAQSQMDRATAAASSSSAESRPDQPATTERDSTAVSAMPTSPSETVLADAATRQRYLEAMQRYYEYRANGYAYRSRVFEWQLFSSRLIFGVVLVLVGAGIYFAGAQFRSAMRAASRAPSTPDTATQLQGVTLATQFEVSSKGIVVNSSVMGVIILTLSLAFFYLYLAYVYPITDVF